MLWDQKERKGHFHSLVKQKLGLRSTISSPIFRAACRCNITESMASSVPAFELKMEDVSNGGPGRDVGGGGGGQLDFERSWIYFLGAILHSGTGGTMVPSFSGIPIERKEKTSLCSVVAAGYLCLPDFCPVSALFATDCCFYCVHVSNPHGVR